jgi:hypothetical protein
MVWCTPSFGSTTTEIMAGITPTRTSLKLNFAVSTATAMSAAATRPIPPPKACPLIAAITGLGPSRVSLRISTKGLVAPLPGSATSPRLLRSAPAQKAGPLPVSTIARTAGSAMAAFRCSPISFTIAAESALRFCGESSVIHAAGPRLAY